MKKAKLYMLTAAILAAFLTIPGCKNKNSDSIKIGGIGPLTGEAAIYGTTVKNGAEIAISEINEKSNIKFEFNFQDDENDAEKSINAYNSLKDWGMHILLGTVTTNPCIAVSYDAYIDRLFTITPSASSTDVIKGKDNIFQVCFTDPNQGVVSAKYISENKLADKIAVIYKNDDTYSTGIYESFKKEAAYLGLDIVSETAFTSDTSTDFSVQINAAKSSGAELIFLPIYYTPVSLILSQAKSIGYNPTFFGVDGLDGLLSIEGFDTSLAEGVILLTPFYAGADDKLTKRFTEKYKESYGDVPNQFAANGYDAVWTIYEAVINSGVKAESTFDEMCEPLIQAMPKISVGGLTGAGAPLKWNPSGEVSKNPLAVVIKNGKYVDRNDLRLNSLQ